MVSTMTKTLSQLSCPVSLYKYSPININMSYEDEDQYSCRPEDVGDLLEQLDINHDTLLDLSLDFNNFSNHDRTFNIPDFSENIEKRKSKSLSGGVCVEENNNTELFVEEKLFKNGLVTAKQNEYVNLDCYDNKVKRYSSHFSGGGLVSINDDDFNQFDLSLNDLPNTNPFKELIDNPCSSLDRSPSQCSTRPASPVVNTNPFTSNPLESEASPDKLPYDSSSHLPITVNKSNSSTQTELQFNKLTVQSDHSEHDLTCLLLTMKYLKSCGWYYENLSWQESVLLLKNTSPGTFLIRASGDPNFLFSLSVQTKRGPTSIRLHYINGKFRLDAEQKLVPNMPYFNSVLELIDYYIENTVKNKQLKYKKITKLDKDVKSKEQVWIDAHGNVYSNILLTKPLYKQNKVLSLQHLSRLVINKQLSRNKKHLSENVVQFKVIPVYDSSSPFVDNFSFNNYDNDVFNDIKNCENCTDLPLPDTLIYYLKEYPYCH